MIHEHSEIMNNTAENIILKKALHQVNQITGGILKQINVPIPKADMAVDTALRITVGKEKHDLWVEIKHELRQPQIPAIIAKIGKDKENWILVARYIPQPIKNQFKELGINYLEAAGNCFIHVGGLFMYINDQRVTAARQTTTAKLWKQAGLKFLFVIISNPALLNTTYRTIAEAANIALGNIGPLMQELEQSGYIKKKHEEWVLNNKDALIKRWIDLYHVLLKPRYEIGRFRFLLSETQQQWKTFKTVNFYWGGEPAAELLTNFLQAELFTIYTNANQTKLVKELKLIPDTSGNLELVEKFWNYIAQEEENATTLIVPPLLVYADLMTTNDSRNWEAAGRIKSKFLND
jgi:hypothetical protein